MSQVAFNTQAAQVAAYTATPGVFAGATALDATRAIGQALYALTVTTLAWFAQGIDDTVFTADSTTDTLTTAANHNLTTGQPVQVSTSTTLPAGLAAATTYWVVITGAKTFKLATSRANAIAAVPTVIDITTNGTGVQTASTVATKAAGSSVIAAGQVVILDGSQGAKVSVIQDTAGGNASLTPLIPVR